MKKFYNIDQMVSVEKFGKGYGRIEWRERRKRYWLLPADPEGYWKVGGYSEYDYYGTEMPDNYMRDEFGIYLKPHLAIDFSDGSSELFYYDDEALMEEDFLGLSEKINNIYVA